MKATLEQWFQHVRLWKLGYQENYAVYGRLIVEEPERGHRSYTFDCIFRVCRSYPLSSELEWAYIISYDVMNDVACVELIYCQGIVS